MSGFDDLRRSPSSGRPSMGDIVSKRKLLPEAEPAKTKKAEMPRGESAIPIRRAAVAAAASNKRTYREFAKDEKKSRVSWKSFSIILGIIFVLGVAYIALSYFSEAAIAIAPRQEFMEVDDTFGATADSSGEIAIESVSIEETLELEAPIATARSGTEKAQGQVVIYNEYSTEPQTLIASTRLETPGGKIYRIPNAITVPGAKLVGGKLTASSIETTVFADKAGPEYNLGLSDFTIPGFKGTSKYTKFYARSKTEIMGGFTGSSKVVTKEDVDGLVKKAEDSLRAGLKEKIERDLPKDIFLPNDAVELKVTVETVTPPVNSAGDNVKVKVKGVANALALKRSDVSKSLARRHLVLAANENSVVHNLESLNFEVIVKDFEKKTLTLKITGRANFVWQFDEDALKRALTGARRSTRNAVFKDFSGIERAEINFRPAWWRIFPRSSDRIIIEQTIRENP